ncbi:hypothetical protein H6P81_004690 [Aristolochia fimbriata]|uniref:Pentatricopeptide repeat-containing protein n=1 Tax=Aristolochia fimbriata TaxID=158543 RepID=A0AAV7EVY7_ARIFI|nr:hypothetical protein H6P81_004690 [Aristolochia fimbriata]
MTNSFQRSRCFGTIFGKPQQTLKANTGYIQNDGAEEWLVLFNEMRSISVEPNEVTVGIFLNACSKLDALHRGKWFHCYIITFPLGTDLLDMYVKSENIGDARTVFNELPTINLVSWTVMIVGYMQRGILARPLSFLRTRSGKLLFLIVSI